MLNKRSLRRCGNRTPLLHPGCKTASEESAAQTAAGLFYRVEMADAEPGAGQEHACRPAEQIVDVHDIRPKTAYNLPKSVEAGNIAGRPDTQHVGGDAPGTQFRRHWPWFTVEEGNGRLILRTVQSFCEVNRDPRNTARMVPLRDVQYSLHGIPGVILMFAQWLPAITSQHSKALVLCQA